MESTQLSVRLSNTVGEFLKDVKSTRLNKCSGPVVYVAKCGCLDKISPVFVPVDLTMQHVCKTPVLAELSPQEFWEMIGRDSYWLRVYSRQTRCPT